MVIRRTSILIALVMFAAAVAQAPVFAADNKGPQTGGPSASSAEQPPVFPLMAGLGKKVSIDSDHYLTYDFDKKPSMGTVILKVNVHAKDGNKDTSFEVLADSGMPSMRGAHDTGDLPMQLSRKKEYLLPIDIVMPGEWEIRITIKKAGKVVFRGSHRFDV